MAKKRSVTLNRLAGKKVVFCGKFDEAWLGPLKSMVQAQQGTIAKDLTKAVDYLVLAEFSVSKTLLKKAVALNSKGAAIQVIEGADFQRLANLTRDELLALLQDGTSGANTLAAAAPPIAPQDHGVARGCPLLSEAQLDGLDLSGFDFGGVAFERCTFIGAKLDNTRIPQAIACDFSQATGVATKFGKIDCSRFVNAKFSEARLCTHLAGSDFSGATLANCRFAEYFWASGVTPPPSDRGPCFAKAHLNGCSFDDVWIEGANFDEAELADVAFKGCHLSRASFRKAKANDALLVAADLRDADLSNAMLVGANLAECDLSGATLQGADLTGANLRGATLTAVTLKGVKGVAPDATATVSAGPALNELDAIFSKAQMADIAFRVGGGADDEGIELRIRAYPNFASLYVPAMADKIRRKPIALVAFSRELLQAGRIFGHLPVRFESLVVKSTKSPTSGKELRTLVMQGIAEAFGQEMPTEDALAAAQKQSRAAQRQLGAAERERREQAKAEAEKQKEKAKKQIAKQIEKTVGKVTDVATFLKALELRIEKPKIDKATKMLKASGFKLFNDVSDESVAGVVKSQTDPDLVYACRIDHEGHYACCTQNLNICGGLRGSICKHLLVLIVGLVQAGELDPNTIDSWIAKTHNVKAELDKENMGAIFLKYKGAEAGEVDWRPTETVPEDYYAL
jgi:uncharacterized protein YjbI with pentapeptide repeats